MFWSGVSKYANIKKINHKCHSINLQDIANNTIKCLFYSNSSTHSFECLNILLSTCKCKPSTLSLHIIVNQFWNPKAIIHYSLGYVPSTTEGNISVISENILIQRNFRQVSKNLFHREMSYNDHRHSHIK